MKAFDSLSIGEERGKLYKNRNWLYQKYIIEQLSAPELSKLCDVNPATIASWLEKLNIKSRNHSEAGKLWARKKWDYSDGIGTKIYHNKELLEKLYLRINLSSVEIGEICGAQSNVIMSWLRRYKIPLRPQGWYFKGKKRTKKEIKKIRDAIKEGFKNGRIPWDKGKKRPKMKGKNNPNYGGKYTKLKSVRQQISKANKGRKIGEEEMQRRLKSWNIRPSGLEKLFDKITPKIIRYVGDGSWWRKLPNGSHKNPDFKVTGQNKVIELYGDYWHRNDDPQELIDLYKHIGLKCLVIWENEVYNNKKEIMERVNNFLFT